MAKIQRYLDAPGAAELLNVCSERGRQLFRSGEIPTVALVNGTKPLTTPEALLKVSYARDARAAAKRAAAERNAGK
jgi:hypothetical protein